MQENVTVVRSRTHLFLAFLGFAIIVSWVVPGLSDVWQRLDERAFRALNGILTQNKSVDRFFAYANQRWFDLVAGIPLGGMMLWWIFAGGRKEFRRRGALMFVAIGLLGLTRVLGDDLLELIGFKRKSPSMVMKGAHLMKRVVRDIPTKYASSTSFPGDHAMVSAWITLIFWLVARKPWMAITAACIALIAWIPRLVVGSHWLSDNIVGGIGIAMLVVGVAMWTGLYMWLVLKIEKLAKWIGGHIGVSWFEDPPPPESAPTSR